MAGIKIVQCDPKKPRYVERLTDDEWDRIRPFLEDLHDTGVSIKEIHRRAKAWNKFRGSYSTLYTRFVKWGFTNLRSDGYEAFLPVAVDDPIAVTIADVDEYRTTAYGSHPDTKSSTDEDQPNLIPDIESQLASLQEASNVARSTPEPTNAAPTTAEDSVDNHEAHPSDLAHSDSSTIVQVPKRSRSLVSSIRSSWSSDTQSFRQLAKRSRYL